MPDLPGLDAFGEALVDRARRDELAELGLDRFGEALVARVRRPRRRRLHAVAIALALAVPVAATSGAATALVLKTADIGAPDPSQVPDEQTPLAGTARVSPVRAPDPGGGYPWAVRVARSKTGFTCTTVGQVHDGTFGLVGLDHVFRRLPADLSDACGQGGALLGARVVAANAPSGVRTIVYGAAGNTLASATLITDAGRRALRLGRGGTFVAALRGYPEDHAVQVALTFAGGRRETHDLGAAPDTLVDPAGGPAWTVERYTLGTRQQCAHIRLARRPAAAATGPEGAPPISPTACLGLRTTTRSWVADARTFTPGEEGVPGFDRWSWGGQPARTVVWGVGRTAKTIASVTLLGAGAPRHVTLSTQGAFAAVLPASVDPAELILKVRLRDGTTTTERPGSGLVPDLVASRRPR